MEPVGWDTDRRARLGSLEYFGLFSGIIGLLADAISLGMLSFGLGSQATGGAASSWIAAVWVLLFMGIMYTVVIASFYARRLGALKHRQRLVRSWSSANRDRVERGARFVSFLVGVPLILSYCAIGAVALYNTKSNVTPADLFGAAVLMGFVMGAAVCPVIYPLNEGAMHLYAMFDPSYNEPFDRDVEKELG